MTKTFLKNKTSILTTDLKYCIEKANDLNDGLILVNYTQINDQFVVLYGDTQIQGTKNIKRKSFIIFYFE